MAERKVKNVLLCGGKVRVVSPHLTDLLLKMARQRKIDYIQGEYHSSHLEGASLVYAATSDRRVNAQIARDAVGLGLLVNVCDSARESTFILPAVLRKRRVTIAVSTDGLSPAKAVRIRDRLKELVEEGILTKTEREIAMKERRKGKVYLVGAGPGDPELITVKGLKLIQKADAIVYDFLIDKRLLSFARKDAELICAGKSPSCHTMKQEEINRLLAEKVENRSIVVRLKNGDPFVFGRGAEEAVYLTEQNIPFEVVSGVSSAIAVPASAGVPLTHRDYASSVAIITGHRRNDEEVKTVDADTLVFLMPVANLERIAEKLLEEGKSPETPCVLIEKGTLPGQKVVQGNLANIFKDSKARDIRPPAVFVVGEIVNLRNLLIQA